ncbi:MAG: type II toxin-antitoxin system HigB family toxin [Tannerella sp.]|jgi:mRNA interferase HigB|nr:type II toxin-antitoxin system HigB family toxin [Tannerella sp.]
MRIITRKRIDDFSDIHADAANALNEWYDKAELSNWTNFAELKQSFNSVDSVGNKRYVFNIKGNMYRLVALILFTPGIVYIRFIGTHTEYNRIKDCSKL